MPLSEHEQRILEEIEKNLLQEDPRFARGVGRREPRFTVGRQMRLGKGIFLAGFAFLIAFFVWGALLFGVLAFGSMVAGIVLVAGSLRTLGATRRGGSDRLSRALRQWEEKIRRRYKGG